MMYCFFIISESVIMTEHYCICGPCSRLFVNFLWFLRILYSFIVYEYNTQIEIYLEYTSFIRLSSSDAFITFQYMKNPKIFCPFCVSFLMCTNGEVSWAPSFPFNSLCVLIFVSGFQIDLLHLFLLRSTVLHQMGPVLLFETSPCRTGPWESYRKHYRLTFLLE